MKFSGLEIIQRGFRQLRKATGPRAVVLLYHRVADLNTDPQLLSVHPQRFKKQMEYLATHYRVWSLQRLLNSVFEDRCLPERVVAMTFDDGYADNFLEAKPILETYHSPATVFISTAYMNQDREFWWDELERVLLLARSVPARLRVTVGGRVMEWPLDECAAKVPHRHSEHATWNVTSAITPAPCYQAYRDLHRLLRPLGFEKREQILTDLRVQVGCDERARSGYRAMQEEEVRQLAASGLIDIGAHTVTHPVFATQSTEARRYELLESKSTLETILGRRVTSFAYPFGGPSDIGDTSPDLIQEAGYEVACSTIPHPVTLTSDRWRLPRCLVRNWDGDEFAERLDRFFHG